MSSSPEKLFPVRIDSKNSFSVKDVTSYFYLRIDRFQLDAFYKYTTLRSEQGNAIRFHRFYTDLIGETASSICNSFGVFSVSACV